MEIESFHWSYHLFSTIFLIADFLIRIGLSTRVIMRKRSYGVSLAWLVVILLLPFAGGLLYLFFGENRLSDRRVKFISASQNHYQNWLKTLRERAPVCWTNTNPEREPIHRQADKLVGIPALDGNSLELIETPTEILHSIIKDINAAQTTCHLQFYIWHNGGEVDEISHSLILAAQRGVVCRVLVDDIGSRDFLRSTQRKEMEKAGIRILSALPAGLFKALFSRIDIRNHRKIVIIDGKIAYTGSQNMVDPKFFKQNEGVGQWVDLMVRITGPVVEALGGTFISDWLLETDPNPEEGRSLQDSVDLVRKIADIHPSPITGSIPIQLVPSGPVFSRHSIHSLLVTTVYAARREITLTTPYFVPDDSLLTALQSAAERGVSVRIIVPKKNDSKLVGYASKARFESLAMAGVQIYLFEGGLLHSKTICVDNDFSLFGSVNLDMRSFWLNFEATLFIYSQDFTRELRDIQQGYIKQSYLLNLDQYKQRSKIEQFKENTALLIGPLL